MEWVLLGERNIEDRERVVDFIVHCGHKIVLKELNNVGYLRVEKGDIASLAIRIISECYEYSGQFKIRLVVQGFEWDGRFQLNWYERPLMQ